MKVTIKRLSALLLAMVMCMGFTTTAFAYSDENTETDPTEVQTKDSAEEKAKDAEEELPYSYSINEDGTIVFSFNGEEYTYDGKKEIIGKVVTGGSRLNVRTGAGMDYEIIDQLRPGEEVSVIGTDGDWYQITVPAKTGFVHGDYLELLESASNETDAALLQMFMMMFMNSNSGSGALTPDGNMSLIDDFGSPTGEGKQFITLTTKNGNIFYLIIDRDDKGTETVHFLNLVDEADLLALMDEEQVEEIKSAQKEPAPVETEPTETKPVETEKPAEPESEKKPNVMPAIILLVVMLSGGGFVLYKKMMDKKKEKEQAKPDPDADYVDDGEDYGYVESEEYDDDEEDYSEEEDTDEPV